MRRITDVVFDRVPRGVIAVLMLVGIAINFANVVGRYVFQAPVFWAEEVLVFIVIWSVFVGGVAVAYNGDHLKVDLVSARVPYRLRLAINAAIVATFVVCAGIVVVYSSQVVALMARSGQVSVAAGVPMTIPHLALLAGFALAILAVLARLRSYLTGSFE